jgi:neurabin
LFCIFFIQIGKSRQSDEGDDDKATKRSKKVSSLCIQLPAAGLGQRTPSMHSSVTDDGGFNEPSPKIEALKTSYDFDVSKLPPVPPIPLNHPDVVSDLTYVDLAHRAQPEGIESDEVYDEQESYRKIENGVHQVSNEKIVYATIKPDYPVKDILMEKENFLDIDAEPSPTLIEDKSYVSPQKMLDPTRAHLRDDDDDDHKIFSKKLPPEPPGEKSETEDEDEKIIVTRKIPPPIPELNSPLDLQDVEFADASDEEEDEKILTSIPDAMTAEEEDRLLSSR